MTTSTLDQHHLWAYLDVKPPNEVDKAIKERHVEGTRLKFADSN